MGDCSEVWGHRYRTNYAILPGIYPLLLGYYNSATELLLVLLLLSAAVKLLPLLLKLLLLSPLTPAAAVAATAATASAAIELTLSFPRLLILPLSTLLPRMNKLSSKSVRRFTADF